MHGANLLVRFLLSSNRVVEDCRCECIDGRVVAGRLMSGTLRI